MLDPIKATVKKPLKLVGITLLLTSFEEGLMSIGIYGTEIYMITGNLFKPGRGLYVSKVISDTHFLCSFQKARGFPAFQTDTSDGKNTFLYSHALSFPYLYMFVAIFHCRNFCLGFVTQQLMLCMLQYLRFGLLPLCTLENYSHVCS